MMIQGLPPHIRRGLLRFYLVVSVLWIAWFGSQVIVAIDRHPYGAWRYASSLIWQMLVLPVGLPMAAFLINWVRIGFQQGGKAEPLRSPRRKISDYYPLIERAASNLPDSSRSTRETLYERARFSLADQLKRRVPPASKADIEREMVVLDAAIDKHEIKIQHEEERALRNITRKPTSLLVISMLFPALWATDFTSMSVYWVVRLPKPKLYLFSA